MRVANWQIGTDGKLQSVTLVMEDWQPRRAHVLSRNVHTGEFAYEIYEVPPGADPVLVYENLTSRRGRK
jgi:hypothetical protein